MSIVYTPCPFCALQCGVTIKQTTKGQRIVGNPHDPISEGHLCRKGLASLEVLNHTQRIEAPLLRSTRTQPLTATSWTTALDAVAERLRLIKKNWGPDSIAVYGSGALTNETAYILGKFARLALGTREIDYNGRFCMSSAAKAYVTMLGLDRPTSTFEDIRQAETLLIVGSNLSDAHPMAMRAIQHAKTHGATIIVIDPRRTRLAKSADYHLAIRPGTDGFLAWAMMHSIIQQNLVNHDFVTNRTLGFEEMAKQARHYSPHVVSLLTGISPKIIETISRLFAVSTRSMLLHGRGMEQYQHGVEAVSAFLNVVLVTGQIGRPGTGAVMLTGQANGQGGRELGQKSDQLPGSRPITDPIHRQAIARVWGVDPQTIPPAGRFTASEFFPAIDRGDIKALMVVGANPLLSAPDTSAVRHAVKNLEFLVVIDPILTETAQEADVVIPAGGFGVAEGTITNVEARIVPVLPLSSHLRPVNAWQDWQVFQELAKRLDSAQYFPYQTTREIFEEMQKATEGAPSDYSGTSWESIMSGQIAHWPITKDSPLGTPRLYETAFAFSDGRARFSTLVPGPATELTNSEYPFHLITGRLGAHYNSGAQTRFMPTLKKTPTSTLFIHPKTARQLAISDGSPVRVTNSHGTSLTLTAHITQDIRQDTVFVSMHNELDKAINHLIPLGPLSLSGMPEFKHTVVSLSPLQSLYEEVTVVEEVDLGITL